MSVDPTVAASEELTALARAYGVVTSFDDWRQRRRDVPAVTLRAVLAAMGVDAADDDRARAELADLRRRRQRSLAPAATVITVGQPAELRLNPPQGRTVEVELRQEDGRARTLEPAREGDVRLPDDLPPGYHRLRVRAPGDADEQVTTVIAAPERVCPAASLTRTWGWMVQLYALRSQDSWGIGDLADLRALAGWSAAELGAGLLLCNPLHAVAPGLPQEPSPYFPSSRRFTNPLYLRVEQVAEVAALDADARARVEALGRTVRELNARDRIDRDAVLRAKMAALELLFAVPRSPSRQQAFQRLREREGRGLVDFATFCALAERHGTPWQSWPAELRHPSSPAVAAARRQLGDRVELHAWLQWLCDEQLAAAQVAASDGGMPVGVLHDLAVGVDPGGADAWALQDDLAAAVTVGAPPDAFNRQGQDWGLPPLLPNRLGVTGYAPFRDLIRSLLRHAGGVRIDHVMGLFRLYWIPAGRPPTEGTYVRYPGDELLGVLTLEAQRAGAVVVGEDLGTVEPGVRERLRDRGILGSRVLYFERSPDGSRRLRADEYPDQALSSVTTHDLPTAAGWWADEALRVQAGLGLLGADTDLDAELARQAGEREELRRLLIDEGLADEDATDEQLVLAMHAFLARTPSSLVAAALGDAVGDRRQPNLPGTTDEYPNWRLPVAEPVDGGHRPLTLEALMADPRVRRLARTLARGRGR